MPYSKASKEATLKHRKNNRKQVALEYKIDEYELEIEPAIKASGLRIATFIKLAIREKIERDNLKSNSQPSEH